jgi:hypothetical protein
MKAYQEGVILIEEEALGDPSIMVMNWADHTEFLKADVVEK